jgi:poly(3-hydroxybutyrate) depolymerase
VIKPSPFNNAATAKQILRQRKKKGTLTAIYTLRLVILLYSIYEAQRAMFEPYRIAAQGLKGVFNHPFTPPAFAQFSKSFDAGAELIEDALKRRGKPEWDISDCDIDGERVPLTIDTVVAAPFGNLIHFNRQTSQVSPKVLLVAPMSGHFATLLRGTVRGLIDQHDVYVTDWTDMAMTPLQHGEFGLDDYIALMLRFMRHLGPDIHVIAVCQPAPIILSTIAVMAAESPEQAPKSMTLMGGPVDPAAAQTVVTELADKRSFSWFKNHCISRVPVFYPGAGRQVYPGFLQISAFMAMNAGRHINAHIDMFRHLVEGDGDSAEAHRRFYGEYLAVMDIPAQFYLDTIDRVFQRRCIATGTMTWQGKKVDPAAITRTALLTIEGELDDISAPGQTYAAHALCTGLRDDHKEHYLQQQVGHYGIFNGRKWRQFILPKISGFIQKHT